MNSVEVIVDPPTSNVGDQPNITAIFRQNNVVVDPESVTLTVTDPNGDVTTYGYPTGSNLLTRVLYGQYQATLLALANHPGVWSFTWSSTSPVLSQSSGFLVNQVNEQTTITVVDQNSAPLSGVSLAVFALDGTQVGGGTTGAVGTVVLQLLPGSYQVELALSKTSFVNPYTLVVANTGEPQTVTLSGTTLTIVETSLPELTRLFDRIIGADGQPAAGVRVVVETVGYGSFRPYVVPGSGADQDIDASTLMVKPEKRDLRTDANGYWEADVVQGSMVRIEIPAVRFAKVVRVPINPNNPTQPILALRDVRPDPGPGANVGISSDTPDQNSNSGPG